MNSPSPLMGGQQRTTSSAFEIREYRDGDELAWLSLFRDAFPNASMSADVWRWKYRLNPLGCSHMALAFAPDGLALAHAAIVPFAARVFGQDCTVGQLVDAMSHPLHRVRGAFTRTARAACAWSAEAGESFAFGFPNERHLRLGEQMLRYNRLSPLASYVRLLDSGLRRPSRPDPYRVRPVSRFGAEADALWHRSSTDYPSAIRRDAAYLNWRYCDCPVRAYQAFALEENGLWQAWAIVSVERSIARLVDMLVLGSTPADATDAMIRSSLRWAASQDARYCETWLSPHSPAQLALLRAGFQRQRKWADDMATDSFRAGLELKDIADTFYFQMGDADSY